MNRNASSPPRRAPGRSCREPGRGVLQRLVLLVLLAAGSAGPFWSGTAARAAVTDDVSVALTPEEWQARLRQHTDDFATARLRHHEARQAIERGDLVRARALLEESAQLDSRFDQAHRSLAIVDLRERRITAAGEIYEAARDRAAGFRNQALSLANLLLTLDTVLALLLVWCAAALLLRYLPFVHHRLAQRVLTHDHRKRRAALLWPAIIAPMLALLAWGVVPWLAAAVAVIWVHGDRRPRMLLGTLLVLLAAQAIYPRAASTLLVATDPTKRAALVERAAYEPPSHALLAQLHAAREAHPDDPDLLLAEGLLLARRGDFAASNEALLRNLALRPEDVASTNNLAANHFFLGDMERAVAGFQRAAALDSTRAAPYYNLSQAYMKKLFLKEGGIALQQSMRAGFALTEQVERLPRGAVYFLRPSIGDYWRMAWNDPARISPFEVLGARAPWLGVPPGHIGPWLAGMLVGSMLLGLLVPRRRLVFECVNCGTLACRHCRGEHEGAVLCQGCAGTARRAKSEMVLTTLLRNRRRDAESSYLRRLRNLDGFLLGAGALSDGVRRRGLMSGVLIALAGAAVIFGGAPLRDTWDLQSTPTWSVVRIAGIALLFAVFFLNLQIRSALRTRHLQPHPSSAVSLAGLIENRPQHRARAGAN